MVLFLGLIMIVVIVIVDEKVVALGITIATGLIVVTLSLSVELSHVIVVIAVDVAVEAKTSIGDRHVGLHANIKEMRERESVGQFEDIYTFVHQTAPQCRG